MQMNIRKIFFSFVNIVRTKDGGTHETGARNAFTKVFNDFARRNGLLKDKDKTLKEAMFEKD